MKRLLAQLHGHKAGSAGETAPKTGQRTSPPARDRGESDESVRKKFVEDDAVASVGTHHEGSFHIYMAHKITKLADLHRVGDDELQSRIFSGCKIFVNGVTNPPIQEIRRLVTLHGGEFVAYRVASLTHFVCDYWTDAQLKALYKAKASTRKTVFNVTAAWVTESIRAGKRLGEWAYLPKGVEQSTLYGGGSGNISAMFRKQMHNTVAAGSSSVAYSEDSSSASTEVEVVKDSLRRDDMQFISHAHAVADIVVESPASGLTLSQQEFLHSVPSELRSEVKAQILSVSTRTTEGREETTTRTVVDAVDSCNNGQSANARPGSSQLEQLVLSEEQKEFLQSVPKEMQAEILQQLATFREADTLQNGKGTVSVNSADNSCESQSVKDPNLEDWILSEGHLLSETLLSCVSCAYSPNSSQLINVRRCGCIDGTDQLIGMRKRLFHILQSSSWPVECYYHQSRQSKTSTRFRYGACTVGINSMCTKIGMWRKHMQAVLVEKDLRIIPELLYQILEIFAIWLLEESLLDVVSLVLDHAESYFFFEVLVLGSLTFRSSRQSFLCWR